MLPTPSSLLVIFLLLARHGLLAGADLGLDLDVTKESSNNVHINGSLTEVANAADHELGLLFGGSGSTPPSSPSTSLTQGLPANASASGNFIGFTGTAGFALSSGTGAGSGGAFGRPTNASVFGASETTGVGGPVDTGNLLANFGGQKDSIGQGQNGGGNSDQTTVAGGNSDTVQTPFPVVQEDSGTNSDGGGGGGGYTPGGGGSNTQGGGGSNTQGGGDSAVTPTGGTSDTVQTPFPGAQDDSGTNSDGGGGGGGYTPGGGGGYTPGGGGSYTPDGGGSNTQGGGDSGVTPTGGTSDTVQTPFPGAQDDSGTNSDGGGGGGGYTPGGGGGYTPGGGGGYTPGGGGGYTPDGGGSNTQGAGGSNTQGAGDSAVTSPPGSQSSGGGNGNSISSSGGGLADYVDGGATTGSLSYRYPNTTGSGSGSGSACATAPTIIAPSGFPAATYPPSVDALTYLSSSVYRQPLPASLMANPTMMTCLASALFSVQKSWVMNPSAWSDINAIWSAASHSPEAVASMSTTWNYVAIMTQPWYSSYVPSTVQADVSSYDSAWMSIWAAITNSPTAPCPAPTAGPCDGSGGNGYAASNASGVASLGGGAASNSLGVVNLGFTAGCATLTGTAFGGGMTASVSCSTGFRSAWWNSASAATRTACSNTTNLYGMPTQTCTLVNATSTGRAVYGGATPGPSPLPVALTAGLLTVLLAVVLIL